MAQQSLAKTELFAQWRAGSMVVADQSRGTGRRVFVQATDGTDATGYGANPEKPVASTAYAITLCTANDKDIVYLMPGHAETVTTTITPLAGMSIVGLGNGNGRAQLTPGAANLDLFTISAANVRIEGIYINESTVAATDTLFTVTAPWFHLKNCHWDAGANDEVGIDIGALACHTLIEDCSVMVTANGPDSWIRFISANVDMPVIRRNFVVASDGADEFDDEIIDFGGLAVRNPAIYDNVFDGHDVVVTSIDDFGAVLGPVFAGNTYAGAAVNNDNVASTYVTLLDDGVAAAKIAADAITNAKIADNALSDEQIDADFTAKAGLGIQVTRAAADIFTGGQVALFTVAGGPVLVTHLQVTTSAAAMSAGASNTQFLTNPTTGTDAAMCAVLDIDGDEIGTVYSITGEPATAMTGGSGGGAPAMIAPWIVPVGTIDVVSAADSGLGGALGACALWYKPLVTGATVVNT